jgi:cytochrome c oxidase assembly protein subunit 11
MEPRYRKNLNVLLPCFVVVGTMFGLVAYAPELYRAFCGATGYGGTTQRAYSDPTATSDKTVTVAFDSNVAPDLPWRFEPEQRSVTVHLGEQKLVFFTAENLSNESIVGHATFNVTPETSGIYFNKIQCFCFNEERLDPHQKVENARSVLCRSGICERFRQRPRRHDHAQLYVVALGKPRSGQEPFAVRG